MKMMGVTLLQLDNPVPARPCAVEIGFHLVFAYDVPRFGHQSLVQIIAIPATARVINPALCAEYMLLQMATIL